MSKSKGGFLTVSSLMEEGYDPMVYRMFCLLSHYRKPLEFSEDILKNVANSYNKLIQKVASLKDEGEVDENAYTEYDVKFAEAMGNDINTSSAITDLVYPSDSDCQSRPYTAAGHRPSTGDLRSSYILRNQLQLTVGSLPLNGKRRSTADWTVHRYRNNMGTGKAVS